MTRIITTTAVLCALLGFTQQADALGPPVEFHGTLDLMDPNQASFYGNGVQLNYPVDDSIQYANTNRIVLDFDFADMKHLEISGTDSTDLTISLLFDDGDLRNVDADIQVRFGFTDMNGEVIGDLLDVPFASVSGANQIGATTDVGNEFDPLPLPEQPLIFHDVLIIVETDHLEGLFSVDSFSFNDNGFSAASIVDPTGAGIIQVGDWVPEPSTLALVSLGLLGIGCRRRERV